MTTHTSLLTAILLGGLMTASSAFAGIGKRDETFLSEGKKIRVEIFSPSGNGRHPAVLVLYSAAGTLAGKQDLEDFSRQLAEHGKVAFFVHYFDRTGTIFAGGKAINQFSSVWRGTVKDAVDFAAAHPRVQKSSIGIFGYSLGAFLAVAESSLDPRIDAIVEVAGGIFEGFAPRMRRLPFTLILHGRADKRVAVSRAYELQAAAERLGAKSEMKIYEGEGHLLSRPALENATHRALVFFERHL